VQTKKVLAESNQMLKFLVHMATAGNYPFHRDELYYLACGRAGHLGQVDDPGLGRRSAVGAAAAA
jgi:hypothetical protein